MMQSTATAPSPSGKRLANKLPALTAAFWLMKITATTLGETGGDWLSMTMSVGYLYSTVIFFVLFAAALGWQLMTDRYRPLVYWTVIVATSTSGTTISDYMDRTLELGYATGSAILIAILLILLIAWHLSCGTINVGDIRSRRAEIFYWITILFSNTLGTACGDFLADSSGLGFFKSWLLITALLMAVLGATALTRISRVALFWLAFVLTRPFGATFGDLLTKTPEDGGLHIGRGYASLILLAILLVTLLISSRNRNVMANRSA